MTTVLAQTGLGSVLDDRLATTTGLLGALGCGLLAVLLAHASPSTPVDESLDELPFVPGMVLAMGSPDAEAVTQAPATTPPAEPSEPQPSEPQPETPPEDTVTDEVTPPSPPRPPKPSTPAAPSPQPPRTDLLPRPPSSPGGSPAGAPSKGDPFGDPNGFDDLTSDGDAWARGVIAALDGMDVGTVYAKPIEGTVRFELTICKDGTISRVAAKGGTASLDERDLVLLEVGRLKIPRPPADIAARMKGPCTKLRHTFSWSTKGTR
ncbi:hypothetical protein [Paraliomyxa miuraensis]|uniref:hypothetical protein n=1 Tax=Paraliomyxa miuraensis TaxID=376150 RepID=UPI00224F431B|nr:hypothetical protein [Paraliomyxa miuraensis]MCX4247487.1 hypothetical protein [Paraliomyxa miuraensis]